MEVSNSNSSDMKKSAIFISKLDKFFGVTKNNSSIKVEIMGGLTTFFAMMYILAVNPTYTVGDDPVLLKLRNAIYIATALGAFIGTLLYALYAKMPFAQAPGMGLNSFFYVSFMVPVIFGLGVASYDTIRAGYHKGLAVIFLSGIIFVLLSVTGIRKKMVESMPQCLRTSIPAGIGLFIAFMGLQNAHVIQKNQYTFVQFVDINFVGAKNPGDLWYNSLAPLLILVITLSLIGLLHHKKIKGAIIIGLIVSISLYYLFNINNKNAFIVFENKNNFNPINAFKDFGTEAFGGAFKGFGNLFIDPEKGKATFQSVLAVIMLILTFLLVDMFDTLGTLQATASEAKMLDKDGLPIRLKESLMSDSVATCVGSVLGVSSVTTYVESSAGVSAGARTGLASLVTSFCFFIFMFLSPLAAIVPAVATAPILVFVGVLMLKSFSKVDMHNMVSAIPAFLTLIMMPLTFSISNGIAIGLISYVILRILTGQFFKKENIKKDVVPAIIAVLFIIRFLTVTM